MGKLLVVLSAPSVVIGSAGDSGRGVCYTAAQNNISAPVEGFDNAKASEVALSVNGFVFPIR